MMNAMNEKELEMVVGGDDGDIYREGYHTADWRYPYIRFIGDSVEVYDNFWHTTTTRAVVTNRYFSPNKECFVYYCQFDDAHKDKNGYYTINDIQTS